MTSPKKMLREINGGICSAEGVKAYGIKEGADGLALILADGDCSAAGVFTRNRIKSASVRITKSRLEKSGKIRAIIANSGCANSFTGEEGIKRAEEVSKLVERRFSLDATEVAVASTGPIGKQLDVSLVERQFNLIADRLRDDDEGSRSAAKAIMTTDRVHKEKAVALKEICIGGIAKGSGMIFPDMETMLSFIYTDAHFSPSELAKFLKTAVDRSFNMIVVDGDMSTNDMVLLISTGMKDVEISNEDFQTALNYVCEELAKMIAFDGEGSTKAVEVTIIDAYSSEDAKKASKAVLRSPLVKSSIFGEKPDFGRIIAAIGSSGVEVDEKKVSMKLKSERGEVELLRGGKLSCSMDVAREVMRGNILKIVISLGVGDKEATAWGWDLSCDYVRLNSS